MPAAPGDSFEVTLALPVVAERVLLTQVHVTSGPEPATLAAVAPVAGEAAVVPTVPSAPARVVPAVRASFGGERGWAARGDDYISVHAAVAARLWGETRARAGSGVVTRSASAGDGARSVLLLPNGRPVVVASVRETVLLSFAARSRSALLGVSRPVRTGPGVVRFRMFSLD